MIRFLASPSGSRSSALVPRFSCLAAARTPRPGPTGPTTNPPQIVCPADLAVSGVASGSPTVTCSTPTVTAGVQPVSTTCSPLSGASFPLGTTAVSCTASDAQARQATCSFKVTLKGMSIPIRKIDAFGDSFTAGENAVPSMTFIDTPNAYPTKLQAKLDTVYPGQGSRW